MKFFELQIKDKVLVRQNICDKVYEFVEEQKSVDNLNFCIYLPLGEIYPPTS